MRTVPLIPVLDVMPGKITSAVKEDKTPQSSEMLPVFGQQWAGEGCWWVCLTPRNTVEIETTQH